MPRVPTNRDPRAHRASPVGGDRPRWSPRRSGLGERPGHRALRPNHGRPPWRTGDDRPRALGRLQVSPTGLVFDTRFDTVRQPAPFGYPDWQSGLEAGVDLRGTANDDEADQGYTVELRIPFASFDAGEGPAPAPTGTETWSIALYLLDVQRGGQRGVGWSAPLVGDFHVPTRFGRVTFEQ
ncbi:MAG: hypothetical protein JRH11_08395 [Deltaproteobacteria bacterium]|nr:hypothetical protein [Deltaproteobacteria bacterium]